MFRKDESETDGNFRRGFRFRKVGAYSLNWRTTISYEMPAATFARVDKHRRSLPGGFLVTEGHHNRVLHVTLDDGLTELIRFDKYRPDRDGGVGQHGIHRQGRPCPHLRSVQPLAKA
jgi:hypothetical protein